MVLSNIHINVRPFRRSEITGNPDTAASQSTVTFHSALGSTVSGDLYEPEPGRSNGRGIVVCPGYGSVKELMRQWGNALSSLGYHVLVVGYRGYGNHPGEVGRIFPDEHVEDARSAVRFLLDRSPGPIALLGVSYGGGIAIAGAALEESVDAVISIVGYGSGARHLRSLRRYAEWIELTERIAADRSGRALEGKSEVISLDEILLRDSEAQEWRRQVEAEHPTMRFDVTLESVDRLVEFEPERHLPFDRHLPLLVIHAGADRVIPIDEAHSLIQRAGSPKRLVVMPDASHHAVHAGDIFQRCLGEIDGFLGELAQESTQEEGTVR